MTLRVTDLLLCMPFAGLPPALCGLCDLPRLRWPRRPPPLPWVMLGSENGDSYVADWDRKSRIRESGPWRVGDAVVRDRGEGMVDAMAPVWVPRRGCYPQVL